MSWLVYALLAAVFWGMNYAFTEQVLKKVSIPTALTATAVTNLLVALSLGFASQSFAADWQTLKKSPESVKLILGSVLVCAIANIFIIVSIRAKNATMAAMIEISYPLFTAFFAWAIFREVQVTTGTILGSILIIAGVCCIYFYGKNI